MLFDFIQRFFLINPTAGIFIGGGGGALRFQITNSVRLRASASAYFSRTFGAPTDNKKWTFKTSVKRGTISGNPWLLAASADAFTSWMSFGFDNGSSSAADKLVFDQYSGGYNCRMTTDALRRDPAGHYEIELVYDSANATSTDRVQILVNGERQSVTYAFGPFAQNTASMANAAGAVHYIGKFGSAYFDGVISDTYFIDGQSVPSSFGQTDTNGVRVLKPYSGTYGANGAHLDFKDLALTSGSNVGLGKDVSGNGNYWDTNNISVTAGVTYDSMVDTPTNNYATLNPLAVGPCATMSDGATRLTVNAGTNSSFGYSTIGVTTGKWYYEVTNDVGNTDGTHFVYAGVATKLDAASMVQESFADYRSDGATYSGSSTGGRPTWNGAGTVIGVAIDCDNGAIYFANANTWITSGVPTSGASRTGAITTYTGGSKTLFGGLGVFNTTPSITGCVNFGQRPFTYTPPTGFQALCTANMPAVAIPQPKKHFDAATWTGANTAAGNAVSGLLFQPDFVWSKPRSVAYLHNLFDVVRGTGKRLSSDSTAAESTNHTNGYLSAFNADGFTTSAGATNNENWNQTSATYVGWNWKAGGNANTFNKDGVGYASMAAASLTNGTIAAAGISVNTTAGFSVVKWQAANNGTVGHGLGVAPKFIVRLDRTTGHNHPVYHASMNATPQNGALYLSLTNAYTADATVWNNTAPTSTTFSTGTDVAAGDNLIAYCFAEIAGYSKFGSYVGNGSANGPFVFCGFGPRYVLIKRIDAGANNWIVLDTARGSYNVVGPNLYANLANAENTPNYIDSVANGFKLRVATDADVNGNGNTYVYAAFAEHPFGGSNVAPSPAR
jgi:hypothetical protein